MGNSCCSRKGVRAGRYCVPIYDPIWNPWTGPAAYPWAAPYAPVAPVAPVAPGKRENKYVYFKFVFRIILFSNLAYVPPVAPVAPGL